MYNKKRHSEKIQMKKTYVFVLRAAVTSFEEAETKESGYILCRVSAGSVICCEEVDRQDFAIGRLPSPYLTIRATQERTPQLDQNSLDSRHEQKNFSKIKRKHQLTLNPYYIFDTKIVSSSTRRRTPSRRIPRLFPRVPCPVICWIVRVSSVPRF